MTESFDDPARFAHIRDQGGNMAIVDRATGRSATRSADPARLHPDQLATMTVRQRYEYARAFDQAKFTESNAR